jgi:hypothetical protein
LRPDEDSVSALFPIKLHFEARDCDGMPMQYTRAEFDVSFGGKSVPHSWKGRGSSEYVAELDIALTSNEGSFDLVVTAREGLSHASAHNSSSCVLLRRTIRVQANMQQYIVGGVLAGIALAVLALLGFLLVRSSRRASVASTLGLLMRLSERTETEKGPRSCWSRSSVSKACSRSKFSLKCGT